MIKDDVILKLSLKYQGEIAAEKLHEPFFRDE